MKHSIVAFAIAVCMIGGVLMSGCTQSYVVGKNPKLEEVTSISLSQNAMSMSDSFSYYAYAIDGDVNGDGTNAYMIDGSFFSYDDGSYHQVSEVVITRDEWNELLSVVEGCKIEEEKPDDSGIVALDKTETYAQVYWPKMPEEGYWPLVLEDATLDDLRAAFEALVRKYEVAAGALADDPYDVPGAGIELAQVREQAKQAGASFAIALVGDVTSRTWEACYKDSPYSSTYPFMDLISQDPNRVVVGNGLLLYCIVPVDRTATVSVNTYVNGGEPELLYKNDEGAPFFLVTDAMGNQTNEEVVIVGSGEEPVIFRPDFNATDLVQVSQGNATVYNFTIADE